MFHYTIFHPDILSTHDTKNFVKEDMPNKMFPDIQLHLEMFSTHQTTDLVMKTLLTKCFLMSHLILKYFPHFGQRNCISIHFNQMFPDVIFHLKIFSTHHTKGLGY